MWVVRIKVLRRNFDSLSIGRLESMGHRSRSIHSSLSCSLISCKYSLSCAFWKHLWLPMSQTCLCLTWVLIIHYQFKSYHQLFGFHSIWLSCIQMPLDFSSISQFLIHWSHARKHSDFSSICSHTQLHNGFLERSIRSIASGISTWCMSISARLSYHPKPFFHFFWLTFDQIFLISTPIFLFFHFLE